MNAPVQWLDWPAPASVKACYSLRYGASQSQKELNSDSLPVSAAPYDQFNYALHVGDEPNVVMANRQRLAQTLGQSHIQWLEQVHGTDVVEAGIEECRADGVYTNKRAQVCTVMTADCLPVFFCDTQGSQVAVAHAGWRGLAAGILQKTLQQFSNKDEVMVYLGPAISQRAFEVGNEVKTVFTDQLPSLQSCFKKNNNQKWMADLYELARLLLAEQGVLHCYGGNRCTFTEANDFYSYRRDGQTGRMANLIWLE